MKKRKQIRKPYKSKREMEIALREYERGMIDGWKHIVSLSKACIKAHRVYMTKKEVAKIAGFNKHLYESDESK